MFDRDVQSSVAFSEVRVDESRANGGFGALLRPLDENEEEDGQSMFGRDDHSFINANRKTMLTQKTFITNMHENHVSPKSNNNPANAQARQDTSYLGDQPNTTFVTNVHGQMKLEEGEAEHGHSEYPESFFNDEKS